MADKIEVQTLIEICQKDPKSISIGGDAQRDASFDFSLLTLQQIRDFISESLGKSNPVFVNVKESEARKGVMITAYKFSLLSKTGYIAYHWAFNGVGKKIHIKSMHQDGKGDLGVLGDQFALLFAPKKGDSDE
ncbi:hypothetical protein ACNH6C_06875 [Bdellovibrio bacteriovorus]|uniref:hypothetical protein n=1 Tax=Bdellovibrio bacteriovorus TaxID=959 RepID=UPI003A8085F4